MNELTLVARLRHDLPAGADLTGPERQLAAEITAASAQPAAAPRRMPGFRRPLAVAGTLAAALAVAVVIAQSQPGSPADGHAGQPSPPAAVTPGPAATAAELVAYATRAAAAAPAFRPRPHQWVYLDELVPARTANGMVIGPPYQPVTSRAWTRVDDRVEAKSRHGKLVFSRLTNQGGYIGGWPELGLPVNYAYLDSLPASPAKLKQVIAANIKINGFAGAGNTGIFNAIQGLMQTAVLSPRLHASLYGVLAKLPGVRFDRSVTWYDGRHDLGFAKIEGHIKDEMVISPTTYAFLGSQQIVIKAYTDVASDGIHHYHKGQVLGWSAFRSFGIVQQAGQLP